MTTRAKNNIHKPLTKMNLTIVLSQPLDIEPHTVNQALIDPKWRQAMNDECDALVRNGTWELVPFTSMYKARLVAKGFHQRSDMDYHDTFSLVVKPTTIRLVLSLAASKDTSLFILHSGDITIYLLVYVDHIIITGTNTNIIQHYIDLMAQRFSIKDIGALSYFLGIEVLTTPSSVLLTQRHYISDLLALTKMFGAKPVATPLVLDGNLTLHSGTPLTNSIEYRTLVGSLQYLCLTRPNISYAVNKLSQFMHRPTSEHWNAAKPLLRYLCGTLTHGLFLHKANTLSLHAFSDVDWAGNKDDYTSTSAYIVYLGGHPISCSSKKQGTIARSSTEADDNVGATYLCSNPVFHSCMKHVAIDYHFIRDQVQSGALRVTHVSSADQLANIFTKPLPRSSFQELRVKIGVSSEAPS
ncbi:Retrovirus-related Pol polyprotein from transposon RE2 [Vitis vinifera]|uniref:Retrovirus-related Pol polyprotein from transposon RE2 n=1 Tax=Vitis vinifera TaxID=29760 RepID=A0A438GTY7_VITVI|nr:Retrovirus-related Pol polyprotein from transposon RE2 [Vitis vinifera]